jgi:Zn-dependent M16 (insulinase) family peptidase
VAQIQQALPGLKRDGNTVLSSVTTELLHDESSTSRALGVLTQSDFNRSLSEKIQEAPEEVIKEFESLRQYSEYTCAKLRSFSLFICVASYRPHRGKVFCNREYIGCS